MQKLDTQPFKLALPPAPKQAKQRFLSLFTKLFLLPILAYQYLIAPLIADCCRFHPSCSTYTQEAITKYGVIKGIWLAMKRIARCHPGGGSGYDPVP